MSIALATKFSPKVDELFKAISKASLLTNTDYDWTGAHTVKIYKISTASLNDYQRTGAMGGVDDDVASISRYGIIDNLNATTEECVVQKDRSFIFSIDKMDEDETGEALEASSALAREVREVVVPEVDTYVYKAICDNAGTVVTDPLTYQNVYDAILDGSEELDDNEVPDTERVLLVTPTTYKLIKQDIKEQGNAVSEELRLKGVVGILDGMNVIKVPSSRLPAEFGFAIVHPSATVAPIKLEDYGIHTDTPLASGDIVTGRIVYDAFVLDNKAKGIYYHKYTSLSA